jgi:predicted SnoaL-like aldol condensation-catalyzing enzyme
VRSFSPEWSQHVAHIAPGRDGLFNLIRSLPSTLHYEDQLIVTEGDYVIAHRRFSGNGRPTAWIVADVVRFEDGKLADHWDVLQDEATVDFRILWPQFQQLMSKISGLRANSL